MAHAGADGAHVSNIERDVIRRSKSSIVALLCILDTDRIIILLHVQLLDELF